jgi:putative phage-type endonuclease
MSVSDPAEFAQGSFEWLKWRRGGLGSSEIATLMGESDYDDTPRTIWKRKKGLLAEKEVNKAMQEGTDFEPRARAIYELERGYVCLPESFQHPDIPWARASLDGFNSERQLILEIKCNGREKYAQAKAGQVPPCYRAQIQWQLFVTGAREVHFISLDPETKADIAVVEVKPDYAYWERMIKVASEFWVYVETNTMPPITEKDFLDLENESAVAAFSDWKRAKCLVLQYEDMLDHAPDDELRKKIKAHLKEEIDKLEAAREVIKTHMVHPKVRCAGVKVITVKRKNGPSLDIRLEEKLEGGSEGVAPALTEKGA